MNIPSAVSAPPRVGDSLARSGGGLLLAFLLAGCGESGTATGRSRMQGMIEYQPADGSDGVSGPFEITFVRSSR